MSFPLTMPRPSWPRLLAIAVGSMTCAVVFPPLLWRFVQYTPFLLGFGAAMLTSRVGGRKAGFLAVGIGALGYATFPPPSVEARLGALFGFSVVSGLFSWLVARRYE